MNINLNDFTETEKAVLKMAHSNRETTLPDILKLCLADDNEIRRSYRLFHEEPSVLNREETVKAVQKLVEKGLAYIENKDDPGAEETYHFRYAILTYGGKPKLYDIEESRRNAYMDRIRYEICP